jgi:PEP-CTERM motif
MKTKILGLLAVGLLGGPMAANAVVIYEYSEVLQAPTTALSFSYAGPTFISSDTAVPDYACLTSTCDIEFLPNFPFIGLDFDRLLIESSALPGFLFARDFPVGSFGAVGNYNAFNTFGDLLGTLVVREVAIPEPDTLALLGLGLLGLGVVRRRAAKSSLQPATTRARPRAGLLFLCICVRNAA